MYMHNSRMQYDTIDTVPVASVKIYAPQPADVWFKQVVRGWGVGAGGCTFNVCTFNVCELSDIICQL